MKKYIKCDDYVDYDTYKDAIDDIIKDIERKQKNEEEGSSVWYYYEGIKDGCSRSLHTILNVRIGDWHL